MQREIRHSACPHDCPSTCALEIEVLDGKRIGSVRGAEANSYTSGVVCAKVARYAERIHHPDRVTRPLLRTGPKGSGQFRAMSWDEALDRVAEAFIKTASLHGAEAVWPYYYAGTMGLVQRDGINRLRHVMRYSRQANTICTSICQAGWMAGVGRFTGPDPREMARSDLIVMWGGNPVATQVNVMTHIMRARKERGAKLVVVDPYRTGTAAIADTHLALRPGTDAALACAVMHVAFRDGYADRDYLASFSDCPAGLEAHLAVRSPEWAAAITGLPVSQIEEFAALYCETQRAYIRIGYGFARSRNGAASMHAVTCLPTVTGKWQHEGAGALWSYRSICNWVKTLIEGLDAIDPNTRTLDMSRLASVLTGIGGMWSVFACVLIYVSAQGFVFPNGSAIAMMRHGAIAGTASALLGTNQFLIAALTTTFLGFIDNPALPMAIVIAGSAVCSTLLNFLTLGSRLETAPQAVT